MHKFQNIPQFTRYGSYAVDISWRYLEEFTKDHVENYKLNLDPDYQRAHVWNGKQRARYVEYILRAEKELARVRTLLEEEKKR